MPTGPMDSQTLARLLDLNETGVDAMTAGDKNM
jgi:hypothetical protein